MLGIPDVIVTAAAGAVGAAAKGFFDWRRNRAVDAVAATRWEQDKVNDLVRQGQALDNKLDEIRNTLQDAREKHLKCEEENLVLRTQTVAMRSERDEARAALERYLSDQSRMSQSVAQPLPQVHAVLDTGSD